MAERGEEVRRGGVVEYVDLPLFSSNIAYINFVPLFERVLELSVCTDRCVYDRIVDRE